MPKRSPFQIIKPKGAAVPIVLSIPHSAVAFPEPLLHQYRYTLIHSPDDTDWFLDTLCDFAPKMGITVIKAIYSRWVIDLNRPPSNEALYADDRMITELCPTCDFFGRPIYADARDSIAEQDIAQRLEAYYYPYHQALQYALARIYENTGRVLLWDCHSVRQCVPTIRDEKFPDLILSDMDETTASTALINTAMQGLQRSSYSLAHNEPFKGGYIIRQYGNPDLGWHALQMGISKIIYMDDTERVYHPVRANALRETLKNVLADLIETLVS